MVPGDEAGDAFVQGDVGFVADFAFEEGGVGVGLVDVARLHGEVFLYRFFAQGLFHLADEVHEFHRGGAADVVYSVFQSVFVGRGFVVDAGDRSFDDVIDVGEVTDHVAVVVHLDGLAAADGSCKEHRGHVRPAPGAVDREVAQARHRDAVELAVGVRHQLVALLRRGVERDGIVDLVGLAVWHLRVQAVDAGGRGVNQMPYPVVAARFQDVQEACQVRLQVGVRVCYAVSYTGLGGEVHHFVELLGREKGVERGLVRDVEPNKSQIPGQARNDGGGQAGHDGGGQAGTRNFDAAVGEAGELEADVVVIVQVVDTHHFVATEGEFMHQLRADEAGGAGHEYLH